jgi:hypothetical protein
MKRLLSACLVFLAASLTGCIDRTRVNETCDWTGDSTFVVDATNARHRRHLVDDAQLAEEVAIRYADAEHKRRFGYEGHGGLIDGGRLRNECMDRLVAAIVRNHGVTPERIAAARGERNPVFDLAMSLSFLPFYCAGATLVCVVLRRRFSADERVALLIVTGLASVAASFLGLQLGQLWGAIWETSRVGNGHISSFRAATQNFWIHQHLGAVFIGGIVLFWLVALLCYRGDTTRPATSEPRSGESSGAEAGI